MEVIKGDLVELALEFNFDIIIQGVNCFNRQKSGLAKKMVQYFGTDEFPMELIGLGDKSKLGQIDYKPFTIIDNYPIQTPVGYSVDFSVVNCYTQYKYGGNYPDGDSKPFDYEALRSCMKKINGTFPNHVVGIPKIGSGLAGGDWELIKEVILEELTDVTIKFVILE